VGAVRFDRLRHAIDNLDFQLGAELLRQAVLPVSAPPDRRVALSPG
jgi:hypothetical protein